MKRYIGIEGLKINAPIGYYDWERQKGRDFIIDLRIELDIDFGKLDDQLGHTLNYEKLVELIEAEMQKETKLIETVIDRIQKRLTGSFSNLSKLELKIRKLQPVKGKEIGASFVEISYGND